jgi:hypothetical protein
MTMTPSPIRSLISNTDLCERVILSVSLAEVDAIRVVFAVIPVVIIPVVAVVIPVVFSVVPMVCVLWSCGSTHRCRDRKGRGKKKST